MAHSNSTRAQYVHARIKNPQPLFCILTLTDPLQGFSKSGALFVQGHAKRDWRVKRLLMLCHLL